MNLFMILKIVTIYNIHEFTEVYQLKWRHSLFERLLTKKLLKTKVQVSSKEICNMAIKDRVVAVQDREIRRN